VSASSPTLAAGARSRRRRFTFDVLALPWLAACALAVSALIVLMLAFLVFYAWPAIRFNGWAFFTNVTWNIGNLYGGTPESRNGYTASPGASYGIVVFVFGTVASTALALVIATPLAILVAIGLTYRIPSRLSPIMGALIELMAGIPSVVYGLWGVSVLTPFLAASVVRGGAGYGLLASGIILSLMILPIMSATIRDVLLQFPHELIEASVALGSTRWQAIYRVVLPALRMSILAAFILAAGRALGETIAVLMVSGSALNTLPNGLASPINTIAATIVSQLDSALTDSTGMAQRALGELALVLFVLTLLVNFGARAIMRGADRAGQQRRT
jgi:phosphate transport system permease protein